MVYINPQANFRAYNKAMVDPITLWVAKDSRMADMSQEDLKALADHLYLAAYHALDKDYTMVSQPGPGVLRLRAAITEAKGSKVGLDVFSAVYPGARLLSAGKKLSSGTHSFVGKAGIEVEVVDSVSGARLLAAVDERAGAKTLKGSFDTWDDVKSAYDHWADRLNIRLDELRER